MSDSFIVIIAEDPDFVPSTEQAAAASACLAEAFPEADEVTIERSNGLAFHDCGGNFESVACPACGVELELETWQQWMDDAWDGEAFRLTPIRLRCCQVMKTLHELDYHAAQGFGRVAVCAMNPEADAVGDDVRATLEAALGTRVRVILRHL
jgi:hypothetical protein